MFNDISSPLALLATRRSGKPRNMIAPGPDAAQLRQLLAVATRTPDHGKLFPWQLVVIDKERRDDFAALLVSAYRAEKPDAGRLEVAAWEEFAHSAPMLVAVLSTPVAGSKIPLWEQQLSAGAVCMNIEHAAHAMGFVACWLTSWPAYSEAVLAALGGVPGKDKVAGYIFIGTAGKPLEERPRPEYDDVVRHWTPGGVA
ncbi:nitroreductase family protein [Aquisediminimonas sediminicola]|uniref:nitroreductase family protein n=1 Tax=Alteraquisediminimonas sediminicola TaxID=2676787 RepID=UPI001C8E01AF|nr:nitroreductase [Aquisediminimonas sediminicola]